MKFLKDEVIFSDFSGVKFAVTSKLKFPSFNSAGPILVLLLSSRGNGRYQEFCQILSDPVLWRGEKQIEVVKIHVKACKTFENFCLTRVILLRISVKVAFPSKYYGFQNRNTTVAFFYNGGSKIILYSKVALLALLAHMVRVLTRFLQSEAIRVLLPSLPPMRCQSIAGLFPAFCHRHPFIHLCEERRCGGKVLV